MIDRILHSYLSNFILLLGMKDPLQKHIEKLKIMKESAKRRNGLYSNLLKLNDKVEFDDLTRSKKTGFFSLQPLLFFLFVQRRL